MAKGGLFIEMLTVQYDKIIAVVVMFGLAFSVIFLSVKVSQIREVVKQFEDEIARKTPKYPDSLPVETVKYEAALKMLSTPDQIDRTSWGTNYLILPRTRVTCTLLECGKPIEIAEVKCPFCGTEQRQDEGDRPEFDGDKDGIWDSWERKYKIDQDDPNHAMADLDGDKYSNYAEFTADPMTDPTDPKSTPPIEQELGLVKITANPFKLRFKSIMKYADGSFKFGLNTKENKTHFLKMNAEVDGFKVMSYEQKTNYVERSGIKKKEKADILTLKKGDKIIPLVFDKEVQMNEYAASLYFKLDNTNITVKIKDNFKLFNQSYRVLSIDSKRQVVVISRIHDDKVIEVKRMPGQLVPYGHEVLPENSKVKSTDSGKQIDTKKPETDVLPDLGDLDKQDSKDGQVGKKSEESLNAIKQSEQQQSGETL